MRSYDRIETPEQANCAERCVKVVGERGLYADGYDATSGVWYLDGQYNAEDLMALAVAIDPAILNRFILGG